MEYMGYEVNWVPCEKCGAMEAPGKPCKRCCTHDTISIRETLYEEGPFELTCDICGFDGLLNCWFKTEDLIKNYKLVRKQ